MMQELVEYMVKALVDDPENVRVRRSLHDDLVTYEVTVAEEDLGKVIGRGGRIANALRTVVKAAATKGNQRATIEIVS